MTTQVNLRPTFFSESKKVLVEHGEFEVAAFRYESGVAAVEVKNSRGSLTMLPFQGQQIWRAQFDGQDITMRSMFDEPRSTREYLQTYGGFLIHCGATAMGVPTGADQHPLHGELPNAPYQKAFILTGTDEAGDFVSIGGEYEHIVAFSHHYIARPLITMHAGSACFTLDMSVTNLKNTAMEFMYLAHANFRPVDNSRLVYSAHTSPETIRVRRSIPSHVRPKPGYIEFLEELAQTPERHHKLSPDLQFDPEVVFIIDYLVDEQGWAHSMQVHPDGTADYVRHQPAKLDKGVRWICRTPDQDALGLILPATAEPEGYSAEKQKGNIKIIEAHDVYQFQIGFGRLNRQEAAEIQAKIEKIK
jgi:hypothetical protein